MFRKQDTSVATANKAIADYRKAVGRPADLAELMVFFCEQAAGFSSEVGMDDESYLNALVRMFGLALKQVNALPAAQRDELATRLDDVRRISHSIGYGVGDDMDGLMTSAGFDDLT